MPLPLSCHWSPHPLTIPPRTSHQIYPPPSSTCISQTSFDLLELADFPDPPLLPDKKKKGETKQNIVNSFSTTQYPSLSFFLLLSHNQSNSFCRLHKWSPTVTVCIIGRRRKLGKRFGECHFGWKPGRLLPLQILMPPLSTLSLIYCVLSLSESLSPLVVQWYCVLCPLLTLHSLRRSDSHYLVRLYPLH